MNYFYLRGFTLIEVLIAWAILSSVLFSLIQLMLINSRHQYHFYLETIAAIQLNNMLDRLRANGSAAFREREVNCWNTENQHVLPEGHGSYNCKNHVCTVSLVWQERKTQSLRLRVLI